MPQRKVTYNVVASLDGYIAGPNGEYDWIPEDPSVDFAALFARFDTLLMGRRTYELFSAPNAPPLPAGNRIYVFSTKLKQADYPRVTIVDRDATGVVAALRAEEGEGGIWLFGGGVLFGELLAARLVDAVEVTVAPILLGGGIPLLPAGAGRTRLHLEDTRTYPSGMVGLQYSTIYE